MTKDEAIDRLLAIIEGGADTDESIPAREYISSKLNSMREFAIQQEFRNLGIIQANNYMNYYPEYDADLQDDAAKDYVIYKCPTVIQIAEHMDGFGSIRSGSLDYTFRISKSPEMFDLMQQHQVMRVNGRKVDCYYDPASGNLYVYNKDVRDFVVRLIPRKPEDVPTWNEFKDEYPISNSAFEILEEAVKNGVFAFMLKVPLNKISNSQSDSKETGQ